MTAVGLCGSDLHWFADGSASAAGTWTGRSCRGTRSGGVIATGPRAGLRVADRSGRHLRALRPVRRGPRQPVRGDAVPGHARLRRRPRRADGVAGPAAGAGPGRRSRTTRCRCWNRWASPIHSVGLGHVRAGMSAAVTGAGPIGLLHRGHAPGAGRGRIVVTEPLAHRRAAALALGADVAVAPDADGVARGRPASGRTWPSRPRARTPPSRPRCGAARARADAWCSWASPAPRRTPSRPGTRGARASRSRSHGGCRRPICSRRINLVACGVVALGRWCPRPIRWPTGPPAFEALVRREGLKVVVRPNA